MLVRAVLLLMSMVGVEGGDLEIEDLLFLLLVQGDDFGFDRLDLDDVADDLDLEGFGRPFADQGEGDGGLGLAPHEAHRLVDAHSQSRFVVDLENDIPGFDPGPLGGGIVDRGDDRQSAVAHSDDDPQPAELPFGLDVEVLEVLGLHEGGVGVEVLHQPLEGLVDEIGGVDLVDVLALDQVEDLGEFDIGFELALPGLFGALLRFEHRRAEKQGPSQGGGEADGDHFSVFLKHFLHGSSE